MSDKVSRTPRAAVIRELRQEVGFRCPVDVDREPCGSPYLTWHRFDPPWREEAHHRPEGMIALCQEHHRKADAGAFTRDQLKLLKQQGTRRAEKVQGRFDWMRREYLSIIGGNAYLRTPIALEISGKPAVWFTKNARDEMLLNFDFAVPGHPPRVAIRENFWMVSPDNVRDLTCPPSGKEIRVDFVNGDVFHTRFTELRASEELQRRHHWTSVWARSLTYPLTMVEVWERWSGQGLVLSPEGTTLGGGFMSHCFMSDCGVGMSLDAGVVAPSSPSIEGIQRVLDEFGRLYGSDGYRPGRYN